MADYRLFPSTNGPGLTSYSGNFMAGMAFEVTAGATWLAGFYWWVPSGGDTSAQEFCLWELTGNIGGTVVPNTTVTSGTLTAATWNLISLPTPVPLSPNVSYVAETAYVATHGFAETHAQFGGSDPFAAGITNGPLTAYSDTSTNGGTNPVPSNWISQGSFGTAFSTPTQALPNLGSDSSSNFWLDVLITDTPPTGASYRLWPSMPAPLGMIQDTASDFTLATEFKLSQSCNLDNIWFYSPPGAPNLPTECGIYNQASETLVSGTHNSSPSWSGAAGSGWVSCSYSGVILGAGSYRVAVANSNGTAGSWNDATVDYFTSGTGSNGITMGPLSAPSSMAADGPGQGSYNAGGALTWPGTLDSGHGPSYWVDVEVTPSGVSHTATASLTITPVFTAAFTQAYSRSASLTVSPSFTATASVGRTTSRFIVRDGIAQWFGGTTWDQEARAYRGSGPLVSYGLSTVRRQTPKRQSDEDYVIGQSAGRGMGASMIVEIPHDKETRAGIAGATNGVKRIDYDIVLACFHLAHQDHAEDAGDDVDLLVEAVKERIRVDRTFGHLVSQAGEGESGIEVVVEPSEIWHERVMTVFTVQFIATVFIAPD